MLQVRRSEEKGNIADGIDKALEVLECFSIEKPEWGITEISRRMGLGKSRIFRMLKTLERRNFADGLSFPTPYFPPEKTAEMAAAVQKATDRASAILGYRPRSP